MKAKKFYEWFLVVEGSGSFPIDMLRYDSCFPLREQDSALLAEHHNEKRRVIVVRRGVNENAASVKRWESFLWRVVFETQDSGEAQEVAREPVGSR